MRAAGPAERRCVKEHTDTGTFPRQVLPSAGEKPASPILREHSTKIPKGHGQEDQKSPSSSQRRHGWLEATQRIRDRRRARTQTSHSWLVLSLLYQEAPGQRPQSCSVPLFPSWGSRAHTLSEKPLGPLPPQLCWLKVPHLSARPPFLYHHSPDPGISMAIPIGAGCQLIGRNESETVMITTYFLKGQVSGPQPCS